MEEDGGTKIFCSRWCVVAGTGSRGRVQSSWQLLYGSWPGYGPHVAKLWQLWPPAIHQGPWDEN